MSTGALRQQASAQIFRGPRSMRTPKTKIGGTDADYKDVARMRTGGVNLAGRDGSNDIFSISNSG